MADLHVRSCLLKLANTRGRDLGAKHVQHQQLWQTLEVLQAGIADLCVFKSQEAELGQGLQVLQPGIGDRAVIKVQDFELRQRSEVHQAGVRD